MNMNTFLLGATTLLFATVASADIPLLNYDCPTNIAVHADQGGPVYINGKEAKLKKFNNNAYEAKGSGVTISLTRNPDESWDVSYTGKGGAKSQRHRALRVLSVAPMAHLPPARQRKPAWPRWRRKPVWPSANFR